ncbi:hypothetical protein PanWU01x14_088090, partial [Parasponia andersonii]
ELTAAPPRLRPANAPTRHDRLPPMKPRHQVSPKFRLRKIEIGHCKFFRLSELHWTSFHDTDGTIEFVSLSPSFPNWSLPSIHLR